LREAFFAFDFGAQSKTHASLLELGKLELASIGSQAGALVVIHKSRQTENAVIPAGMQESSAMDGNSPLCKCLIQDTHQPADSPPCDWIPAVHAGMTGFNDLCITMRVGAWEPANRLPDPLGFLGYQLKAGHDQGLPIRPELVEG